ncbi:phosphoglycolate phosphatase [Kordiimonas aestuarii]|uniref:phosphoglycolate phosphatase n=1 Tax=Kordiimonas aestuarii TaxID=1005925 RepID=UPI0021CF6920|nr:phosphoglycolate phosphatase [Kordiimonas aestuarii]
MTRFSVDKIIFDLDGTLVDSAADLHAATNHVLAHVGRKTVTLEQVRHMVGHGAKRLIELGLEATGGRDTHQAADLLPVFLKYYGDHIADGTRVFDGGLIMLNALKDKGFSLAICTNKPLALTRPLLQSLDIARYFDAVTGGDSFDFKKPDPRHLLETARLLPGDGPFLMVGDSINDIAAARDAAAPSVAVDFGYTDIAPHDLGADHLISHLSALPALVRRA